MLGLGIFGNDPAAHGTDSNQAYTRLRAHSLYTRCDYWERTAKVIIVYEFTGRKKKKIGPEERWSDGLHQQVEAQEGVKNRAENQTLATITSRIISACTQKLSSAMTGTLKPKPLIRQKL